MEQHRPKHDRLIIDGETTTFSSGSSEDGIIHTDREEQVLRGEGSMCFLRSLISRLLGILMCGLVAIQFLKHYEGGLLLQKSYDDASKSWGVIALLLAIQLYFAIRDSLRDRRELAEVNSSGFVWLFVKPNVVYLLWTFAFFVFSELGHSWFTWIAAGSIFTCTQSIKLNRFKYPSPFTAVIKTTKGPL